MPTNINLDGVEPWKGGSLLSPGTHPVKCIEAEEGRSSGGHFELHLTWEAVAGPERGGTIQDWVQVTGTTLGKVRQLLDACRVEVPTGDFSLGAASFHDAYCAIVIREKPKQSGGTRSEIVAYQRVSDLGNDQGREFAAAGASAGSAGKPDDPPPF
jgi:hypothetical protein